MLKEFKEFAMRGNVVDMAVGIVIGAAFGRIVSSFVADVLMPPLVLILGKVDFSNMFINLGAGTYTKLAEAKAAGAPTLNYGLFANEQGRYSINARGSSTAYNVYAIYPKMSGTTSVIKYNTVTSQTVTAGATTTIIFTTWLP